MVLGYNQKDANSVWSVYINPRLLMGNRIHILKLEDCVNSLDLGISDILSSSIMSDGAVFASLQRSLLLFPSGFWLVLSRTFAVVLKPLLCCRSRALRVFLAFGLQTSCLFLVVLNYLHSWMMGSSCPLGSLQWRKNDVVWRSQQRLYIHCNVVVAFL